MSFVKKLVLSKIYSNKNTYNKKINATGTVFYIIICIKMDAPGKIYMYIYKWQGRLLLPIM